MWRCANDFMGYCEGIPQWKVKPTRLSELVVEEKVIREGYDAGGVCKLSPENCGKFQTLSEQVPIKSKRQKVHSSKKVEGIKKTCWGEYNPA